MGIFPGYLILLWVALWLGIGAQFSSAPSAWTTPSLNMVRLLAPLAALAVVLPFAVRNVRNSGRDSVVLGIACLAGFGVVGLASSLLRSPGAAYASYSAMAFLGVPILLLGATGRRLTGETGRWLLRICFLIALVLTLVLLNEAIFALDIRERSMGRWLYGLWRTPTATFLDVRSSGIGRYAALTALLAMARLLLLRQSRHVGWWVLLIIAVPFLLATFARTSIAAFAASALFLFWVAGRLRVVLVGGVAVLAALLATGRFAALASYFMRGQSVELFLSLTGRTSIWTESLPAIRDSPIVGWGFHADRLVIGEHVHNAWLQAMLQGGVIGLALFVAFWILFASALLRRGLLRRFDAATTYDRFWLAMAATVLIFFGVRTLTESSGAFFGVDLMFLGAAMAAVGTRERPLPGRIVAIAYTCAPPSSAAVRGGEHVLGWGIATQLASFRRVTVITSADNRESIAAMAEQDSNLDFRYCDPPASLRWMVRLWGTEQLHQYVWQLRALFAAWKECKRGDVEFIHHITYANDWMPSYAGALLPARYVRGPGGSSPRLPVAFVRDYGLRTVAKTIASEVGRRLLRLDPFFRIGHDKAEFLLVCNQEAMDRLPARWAEKASIFPVSGVDRKELDGFLEPNPASAGTSFHYQGKLIPTKCPHLALDAFARYAAAGGKGSLTFGGSGHLRPFLEQRAAALGIAGRVTFTGWLSRSDMLRALATADVFLYPTFGDGGGTVVAEAMGLARPVLCLACGGPATYVSQGAGLKVAVSNPDRVVHELADAMANLDASPALRGSMGHLARERAINVFAWDTLGLRLKAAYEVLDSSHPTTSRVVP